MFARHRQPTGPMWPYVGLLGLLFALSVTAPRAWTRKSRPTLAAPLANRVVQTAATIPVESSSPRRAPEVVQQAILETPVPRRRTPAGPPALAETGRWDDAASAEAAALLGVFQLLSPATSAASATALADVTAELSAPDAIRLALSPSTTNETLELDLPEPPVEIAPAVAPRAQVAWLTPTALVERLSSLIGECEAGGWAMATLDDVRAFAAVDPRDVDAAVSARSVVWQRLREGEALAESVTRPELATAVRRACDALARRLGVWDAALERLEAQRDAGGTHPGDAVDLGLSLRDAELSLASLEDAQVWREYLLLDELRAMNDARASLSDAARRELSREVLDRLASPSISVTQRKALGETRIQRLANDVGRWSDVDDAYLELARSVEAFEASLAPSDALALAAQARRLAASPEESDRELSWLLNQRFRNANVRLEFSADLISRLLPESAPREQAVDEIILGVPSRGHSRTTTRLFFRTADSQQRLNLELLAAGDIDSWTTAESGPARFRNEGRAKFSARRRLRFDRHGLHADPAQIEVDSETELRSVQTDFDRLPLFGRLVQRIARDQYQQKHGAAELEAKRKIEEKVRHELMSETETALAAANLRWRDRVVTPLDRLGLSPKIIEAGSDPQSAVLRVRLAADSQLGANTPRPRLPQNALLALQVHQTALNNVLEGLDLNGRAFNLQELGAWLSVKLNRDDLLPKDSLRDDVWIHFADENAVYTRLVDGQIELNVAFSEFITTHRSWHNFAVRVRYRPTSNDLTADLLREGPVELVGDSVHGIEMALRGIVNRIFPMDQPWKLVPAQLANNQRLKGLRVNHFVIDDGWLSVAVGEEASEVGSRKSDGDAASISVTPKR